MFYCFYGESDLSYGVENLLNYTKKAGKAIIYNNEKDCFVDSNGKEIDIKDMKIYPRAGVFQEEKLCAAIEKHGGKSLCTKDNIDFCTSWLKHYKPIRKMQIYNGSELLDNDILNKIKKEYGNEIFFKTVKKDYSEQFETDYLLDKESLISRCIKEHQNDEFMISEPVKILKDDIGQKEYRIFVIENKIVSISRFTDYVFHKIDPEVYEKSLNIVNGLKDFPSSFVMDVFEYERNGKKEFDVLEFNPISASGSYLYNSLVNFNNNNILHDNEYLIAEEKMENLEEIKKRNQKKITGSASKLFNAPKSFSYDLKSIYMIGTTCGFLYDGIDRITKENLSMHGSVISFENLVVNELFLDSSISDDEVSIEGPIKRLK